MLRESDETSIIRDIWTFLCQSVGMYRRNNMPSDNRAYRKLAGFYKRKTAKNYIMQSFMSLRHRIWLCLRAANHVSLTQHPFQKLKSPHVLFAPKNEKTGTESLKVHSKTPRYLPASSFSFMKNIFKDRSALHRLVRISVEPSIIQEAFWYIQLQEIVVSVYAHTYFFSVG